VHRFLGAEIIEQIGLRHARHFGDLVDGRAAKTADRKHVERRFQDLLFLLSWMRVRRCVLAALGIAMSRLFSLQIQPLHITLSKFDRLLKKQSFARNFVCIFPDFRLERRRKL
jgi:hypothetical protein